jgi:hypothetical protein
MRLPMGIEHVRGEGCINLHATAKVELTRWVCRVAEDRTPTLWLP